MRRLSVKARLLPWLLLLACEPGTLETLRRIPVYVPDGGTPSDGGWAFGDALVDADAASPDGGGSPPDAGGRPEDARPPDPPRDAASPRDAADPCARVRCGDGARCVDGDCVCLPGFVREGNGCAPEPMGPLEARTEAQVCDRWRAEIRRADPEWRATSADACDPGEVPEAAQDNALRRTNAYRWLAGLPPATLAAGVVAQEQACAATLHGLGGLDHHPPAGAPCYSAEGAAGAGSSNLAQGTGLADSVDLFVDDGGVPSLGHRRWVLGVTLGQTAFGHKPPFTCMYTFDMSGRADVDFVAWPPPGYVPVDAARGRWSFVTVRRGPAGPVSIDVAVDGGEATPVPVEELPPGYGGFLPTWAFDPPPGLWADGRTVRVTMHGLEGGDVGYTVRFTACR